MLLKTIDFNNKLKTHSYINYLLSKKCNELHLKEPIFQYFQGVSQAVHQRSNSPYSIYYLSLKIICLSGYSSYSNSYDQIDQLTSQPFDSYRMLTIS